MIIKHKLCISFFFLGYLVNSQNFSGIYKIDPLLSRMNNFDTIYVLNFWATWCKPCVEELPAFDSLLLLKNKTNIKVILVSLDFKEDLEKKVKPFLLRHGVKSECILLDEINGNDFVNKISPSWSGAIPATLFKKGKKKELIESKIKLSDLLNHIEQLGNK